MITEFESHQAITKNIEKKTAIVRDMMATAVQENRIRKELVEIEKECLKTEKRLADASLVVFERNILNSQKLKTLQRLMSM